MSNFIEKVVGNLGNKTVSLMFEDFASNIRLQRMLWVIVYIMLVYFSLLLSDELVGVKEHAYRLQKSYFKLENQEGEQVWSNRLAVEELVKSKLESRLWEATLPGLASADFQTMLQSFITKYEMKQWRLTLSEPKLLPTDDFQGWEIQAEITGKISRENVPQFMNDLEDTRYYIQVVRVSYAQKSEVFSTLVTARFVKRIEHEKR